MTKHVNHQYSVPTIYQRVSYTSIFESSFEFLKFNNQATAWDVFVSKHPTPMTIQLHPQCLLGIQSILRNWTFLIFKQV